MIPRRDFLGTVAGAAAALAASPARTGSPARAASLARADSLARAVDAPVPGGSALVEKASDFDLARFTKIVATPASNKVVWDLTTIGKALGNVNNSLNGYHFGFGFGPGQAHMIVALHGAANTANFSDETWAKYRLGEWLHIDDPKTGKPATRNIWLHSSANGSTDEQDEKTIARNGRTARAGARLCMRALF